MIGARIHAALAMLLRCASLIAVLMFGASAALAQGDVVLRQAHDAWRAKDVARLSAISAQAKHHVLAPYFQYWMVDLAPGDDAIKSFLDHHPGSALAERLRADWIRGLGRRGDWALIAAQSPKLAAREHDVLCWSLRARWEQGDKLAAVELLSQWQTPRELLDPCLGLADQVVKAGLVSPAQVWTRARRLVEAGHPQAALRALRWLPASEAPPTTLANNALGTPDRMLTRVQFDLTRVIDREMVAFGLVRIATDDPDRAQGFFMRIAHKLTAIQRSWVHGQLGLVTSRRAQAGALEWYRRASATDTPARLSDEHYAWWARAAMREGDWQQLRAAIAPMSDAARQQSVWRYWSGRAAAELGHAATARAAFGLAARDQGFYGVLSAEALGWRNLPPAPARPASNTERNASAAEAGLRRAAHLFKNEFRADATREWDWTVARWDDHRMVAAARQAEQLGWWDRVVETSLRTTSLVDIATRYAIPYAPMVDSVALSVAIDSALVYAVMKQESRFMPGARSHAGAAGLMQVMPATADAVAQAAGLRGHSAARLVDPHYNVVLGSHYLKSLFTSLGDAPVLAFAGYNAGPGRALAWRAAREMDGAAYAESIPFDETRDYVKHVAANAHYYRMRLDGEVPRLTDWLGTVAPAPTPAAPAISGNLQRVVQR